MNCILFTHSADTLRNLYPFTLTRLPQDIRLGILTIREKWERYLKLPSFDRHEPGIFPAENVRTAGEGLVKDDYCYLIPGNLLPSPSLLKQIKLLQNGQWIEGPDGEMLVFRFSRHEVLDALEFRMEQSVPCREAPQLLTYPWEIFQWNSRALEQDFSLLTRGRKSQPIPKSNRVTRPGQVFIEKGASIRHCIINAEAGPVYIGRKATLLEGCLVQGAFAICEGATLKMGAKIYGATTLGPYCTGAGEIKNSVLFGYSNKAHDGYMGDAVIGEWCNWGAGTTNSNLKNNAGAVRVWTPSGIKDVGIKCGVLMGDYSRTAINTSINTGSVIGVSCNVFGAGLSPKHIPSFAWGAEGELRYTFDKAITDIEGWKALKKQSLTDREKSILKAIFDQL